MAGEFGFSPHFVLADEYGRSARRFGEALVETGTAVEFEWIGDADRAARELETRAIESGEQFPDAIVCDLRAGEDSQFSFLRAVAPLAKARGASLFAFAPDLTATTRTMLLRAGADAVFVRHADPRVYQEEVAQMVAYWARQASERACV